MQITLSRASQAKLEEILENLTIYHDLEDLTADDLVDSLLDIGMDLIASDELSTNVTKETLVDYCAMKVQGPIT